MMNIDKQINEILRLAGVKHLNEGIEETSKSKVQNVLDLVKESVAKGGEVVFKNNKWIILIPRTFKSSTLFGTDPNWNTTSQRKHDYKDYKEMYGGEYLININLEDGSIYQFHLESGQYKDSSGRSINIGYFANHNPDLKPFYRKYILDNNLYTDYRTWVWLNKEDITEEVQLEAVKHNGYALEYIKNPSEAVQLAAVKKWGCAISYFKNPSEAVQLAAVRQDINSIYYIDNPTPKVQQLYKSLKSKK